RRGVQDEAGCPGTLNRFSRCTSGSPTDAPVAPESVRQGARPGGGAPPLRALDSPVEAVCRRSSLPSAGRTRPRTGESPISTPAEYSKRAKQAAKAGNYDQAGDFHRLAG